MLSRECRGKICIWKGTPASSWGGCPLPIPSPSSRRDGWGWMLTEVLYEWVRPRWLVVQSQQFWMGSVLVPNSKRVGFQSCDMTFGVSVSRAEWVHTQVGSLHLHCVESWHFIYQTRNRKSEHLCPSKLWLEMVVLMGRMHSFPHLCMHLLLSLFIQQTSLVPTVPRGE